MLSNKLFSSIGNTDRLYVDDVFSAYTYTGNGSTQTINNGIDLAGKGGLVWGASRSGALVATHHKLVDTARGPDKILSTSATSPENVSSQTLTAFSSSGFSLGTSNEFNGTGTNYVSWTFRKAPKFFDIITYSGNGTTNRVIPHSLGITPGFILIKSSTSGGWRVWHSSLSPGKELRLDSDSSEYTAAPINFSSAPTSTNCVVNGDNNTAGLTYVAYLFAHDTSADGIIQSGSFTTDASGNAKVNLGWEPQYLLVKGRSFEQAWYVYDSMRGLSADATVNQPSLNPNTATQESNGHPIGVAANGFSITSQAASRYYIYLAIRRPNKPPTTGTEVYNATVSSITNVTQTVGFPTDMVIHSTRSASAARVFQDKLRGGVAYLTYNSIAAEACYLSNASLFDQQNLFTSKYFTPGQDVSEIYHFFRRAPGFFDVVCRSGTGTPTFTRVDVNHSLGAVPELIIYKCRSNTSGWIVGTFNPSSPTSNGYGQLNQTYAIDSASFPGNFLYAAPTATQFSFWDANSGLNTSGRTYVAYLFASLPGISKVGSYTGNGSSQTINCGFSTGARFILIKRTDSTGDWYVWDTARGIIAANDPHLSLNTTAAEVTTNDSVDPNSTGFIVNQDAATNINVTSSTYLYLAIA